jgi:APA family basic amino acid/polyamine antiporter
VASYALQAVKPGGGKQGGKLLLFGLAFGFSLWVMAGSGREVVFWGFLLLVAGIPFYVWMKLTEPKNGGD